MNNLRSILTKTRIAQRNTAFVSGSVVAAYRVRPTAAIQSRGYASIDTPKKGGSGSLIFLSKSI